mgnify:CR=1 FL=1
MKSYSLSELSTPETSQNDPDLERLCRQTFKISIVKAAERTNWTDFTQQAVSLFVLLSCHYHIKDDLRKYLADK